MLVQDLLQHSATMRPDKTALVCGGRRYSYSDPRPAYRGACVPREQIKYRLQDRGWHDFRDPEIRGETATFIARRPSGRAFELTVDRCSGEIVSVRRLDGPQGPYAYGPGPRRWDRY